MKAGRELDALIAEKVMGLFPCVDPIGKCEAAHMKPCQCWAEKPGGAGGGLKSYSEDISAAWEVVEKLGLAVIPLVVCPENPTPGYWAGLISSYVTHEDSVIDERLVGKVAATAPLAICLAGLKVMGIQVE